MRITKVLRAFFADPVSISFKEKFIAACACLAAIFLTATLSSTIAATAGYPLLVASMGSSAAILFAIHHSPLAQPWPFLGSQLISGCAGVVCQYLLPDPISASAFAVGASMLLMLLLRCLHPPSAGTALVPVIGGEQITGMGFGFVLMPLGINVLFMLMMALVINRWVLRRHYPVFKLAEDSAAEHAGNGIAGHQADITQALKNFDHFVDVSSEDLNELFTEAERLAFRRYRGEIRCGEIMRKNIVCTHAAMKAEEAWSLMQQHKLKAMPVLNASRHVIGIITPQDFFKHAGLIPYGQFSEKFHAFMRRLPHTGQPHIVKHLMSRKVVTLREDAHISELIPLMSTNGHRHIPIIDANRRLAGVVHQGDLIAALYHQSLIGADSAMTAENFYARRLQELRSFKQRQTDNA